ncbi:MAG TPA: type II toxin-antitoxin system RelE/ParE family toxin [Candidatus Sulfotelmatobacter sp.]|nr:type II toxin-antitoxin system RelE/ParE family toxin [Candidatus Sulfotelmatobacter sp.]
MWEVEFTTEFEVWWDKLSAEEQEDIDAGVELLEERGPTLGRPHVDRIHQSRHQNMKELRGKLGGKSDKEYLRVLFAFDPRRTALLLLGGDKTDDPSWYDRFVPIADDMFDKHLKELEQEQKRKEQEEKQRGKRQKKKR